MSRPTFRAADISGPESPRRNGVSFSADAVYKAVPIVPEGAASDSGSQALDHGLAYDPGESFNEIIGFSMDDEAPVGSTPATGEQQSFLDRKSVV